MAGDQVTMDGGIYPRGFSTTTTWPWPLIKSGDLVVLNYGKALREGDRRPGRVPVYGTNGQCGWHDESLALGPGLILGRKGQGPLGVEWCDSDFWVIDTAYYVTPKTDQVDLRYLYYLVKYIGLNHLKDGTSNPSLSRDTFASLLLPIPPRIRQRPIAYILSTLDEKIELNRRMNETLEGMAQALFKSWFVDFDPVIDNALAAGNPIPEELQARAALRESLGDARKPLEEVRSLFPSEFEYTEELGWIPKGWSVQSLDDLIELIGGGTPKTSVAEYWNGNIPWFSVVDAPNTYVFVIDTEKHITRLGVDKSSTKILPVGTTIVSARGTVGKCAMVGEPMAMNQSCYGIIGKIGISDIFVYYAIREKVADLQRSGHGSVFNTITRDTFKTIRIAFGKAELTKKLEEYIDPLFERILANRFHDKNLSILRDILLPKLLSGEIRVSEAEKQVEAAI